MCGIFALLNSTREFSADFVKAQFEKGRSRGPENSQLLSVAKDLIFGFHRLAINGLNSSSNQPLVHNSITLICNGEIYNYKKIYYQLANEHGVQPATQSDCEVILWLYERYGIEHCLQMLDGVFAFALLDQREAIPKLFLARDPYGVRPLYITNDPSSGLTGFASELKMLSDFQTRVSHFKPGSYSEYVYCSPHPAINGLWTHNQTAVVYHQMPFSSMSGPISSITSQIRYYLTTAVIKRCQNTERPVACLLSGGLDSSIITALVCQYNKSNNLPPPETYSIGLPGSVDLQCAQIVARHLNTKHTEIMLTEQDFIDAIPRVIKAIESYDTTTVRASIGNFLLGEYISKNSEAKVIFNGDGSDELLGGYLYMSAAPDAIEFDKECRRLLKDIHAFDVLRSDKSISSHGLEPRTPFLDRAWVQFYLSLPVVVRWAPEKQEKYWLRKSFSKEEYGIQLLPDEILWRRKEAFSDGVGDRERSLYHILQESAPLMEEPLVDHNLPTTREQIYYRSLFEEYYPDNGHVVPYFWMPKYVDATDASARTLDLYNRQ
jgi:asparagine synthase (glutamine-hydrolysing)